MKRIGVLLLLMLVCDFQPPVRVVKLQLGESVRCYTDVLSDDLTNLATRASDGSQHPAVVEAVGHIQYVSAQERKFESSNAGSAFLSDRTSVEMYYDDTWQGYVGVWSEPRRTVRGTVFLTFMSSILSAVAGYWLFGKGSARL